MDAFRAKAEMVLAVWLRSVGSLPAWAAVSHLEDNSGGIIAYGALIANTRWAPDMSPFSTWISFLRISPAEKWVSSSVTW